MSWDAVNLPDPETPVGVKGVGEPPVGAGMAAVLSAITDAVGDDLFRRMPITSDIILSEFEQLPGRQDSLAAHV